jgi:hypothetical protein
MRLENKIRATRDFWIALGILFLSLIVYNLNFRSISAGDCYPARYLPLSILHNHTLLLDPIYSITAQDHPNPFWIREGKNGHKVSLYPVVIPIIITPLYIPAYLYLKAHEWDPLLYDQISQIMEKICASLIAALTSMLIYLLLRKRIEQPWAVFLTLVFAFGTTTWVISSQALWQHSLGQLLVVSTLLLLTSPPSKTRVISVGFLCALMACNRPPDAIFALVFGIYACVWAGRLWPLLLVGGALPTSLLCFYNLTAIGNIVGGYGVLPQKEQHFSSDLIPGLAGLLFSPTHGLIIFSPFLILLPFYFKQPKDQYHKITLFMFIAVILQLLFYSNFDWRQGWSWGPRWLTDSLPILFWMLAAILKSISNKKLGILICLSVLAIFLQSIGAFWYTNFRDPIIYATNNKDPAWQIQNAPFIAELKHKPAPPELLSKVKSLFADPHPQIVASEHKAIQFLKNSQNKGYWLTTYTERTIFEKPKMELNVFVNSLIVELLNPIAINAGLNQTIEKTRTYLSKQIEDNGLVRYYGKVEPDAVGKLGWQTTPDSDDTALVWRIAPLRNLALQQEVINTLRQYLTPQGLYKTWLDNPNNYISADTGRTDMGVQLHIYMFLAKTDPIAGKKLCDSIQASKQGTWVYYQKTPIIPLLRQTELKNLGCQIQLPKELVKKEVAGQENWINIVRLLLLMSNKEVYSSAEAVNILSRIANNDFEYIKKFPPLLYSGDLTTSSRYYWSEEFGYALWLRLYYQMKDKIPPAKAIAKSSEHL